MGGRLGSRAGKRAWASAFGPGADCEAHFDADASRVAAGWTPELQFTPVQQAYEVPRPRVLDPHSEEAEVTDRLLSEQLEKSIIEEVGKPVLPSEMRPQDIDTAMVWVPGVPFKVPRTVYPWVHDVFVVPKSTPGKWRWILMAVALNECFKKHKFKSDAAAAAALLIEYGDYFTAYDIQDFFNHIRVHRRYRNLLVFRHRFRGEKVWRWFRFRGLPFGITDSPRASAQVMRPILEALKSGALETDGRLQTIRLEQHVDDGLVMDTCPVQAAFKTQTVIDFLSRLHFLVSWEKCMLRPAQVRLFSGMLHDSTAMVRRLSNKRLKSVKRGAAQVVGKLLRNEKISLRALASALGRERAARDCVCVAYLQTREILRWQNATLVGLMDQLGIPPSRRPVFDDETVVRPVRTSKIKFFGPNSHWSRMINWDVDIFSVLPQRWVRERRHALLQEQRWWKQEVRLWNGKWLSGMPPLSNALMFESDASGYGAGLVIPALGPKAEVRWHYHDHAPSRSLCSRDPSTGLGALTNSRLPSEKSRSINWKELGTPEPGLDAIDKQFPLKLRDRVILGRLDNTAAVAYINHQGGPTPALSALAESLWRWLLARGLWIFARHLAGVLNVRADRASRWKDDRSEWRLSQEAWHQVETTFGPHTCDLFASRRNALCLRFFSRFLDPDAAEFDAFAHDWATEENAYAHPPYCLLGKVLQKVRADRATITLVAPVWAAQSWFTQLLEMSTQAPRLLVASRLVEPTVAESRPCKQPQWATAVWRISGAAFKPAATIQELRTALWPSGSTAAP